MNKSGKCKYLVHKMSQKLRERREMLEGGVRNRRVIVLLVVDWIQGNEWMFMDYYNNNLYIELRKRRMSEQKTVQEQPLNLREQYKLQKLQQLNQIYYCQCGKNYLTFSALYLHARNKHEVKLTTKRTPLNSKVEQKEDKTHITYFINPQPAPQPNLQSVKIQEPQNSQHQHHTYAEILTVIQLYLDEDIQKQPTLRENRNSVIEQFQNYFYLLQQEQLTKYPVNSEAITLYFNDFICNYIPLAHSQKLISLHTLGLAETELIRFWRWLREHQYTKSELFHRNYPSPSFGQ